MVWILAMSINDFCGVKGRKKRKVWYSLRAAYSDNLTFGSLTWTISSYVVFREHLQALRDVLGYISDWWGTFALSGVPPFMLEQAVEGSTIAGLHCVEVSSVWSHTSACYSCFFRGVRQACGRERSLNEQLWGAWLLLIISLSLLSSVLVFRNLSRKDFLF